jgi:acetyltransferase-like isoleucine patch superfamily enzyme
VVLMDGYRWPLDPEARAAELRHALRPQARDAGDAIGSTPGARETRRPRARPIRIGRDVWIGFGASVLPGVSIGDGAVVGARAVVTTDVAARTLVAGNPARALRAL